VSGYSAARGEGSAPFPLSGRPVAVIGAAVAEAARPRLAIPKRMDAGLDPA
jgi:hypothetical protein